MPLVVRHSSTASLDYPSFDYVTNIRDLPLGSRLNRYEVALLSLSLAIRTPNCVNRVAYGSFTLHCLKWTEDDPKRLLPLTLASVRGVISNGENWRNLSKWDLVREAVLLVGRGYLELGYLPAASWIFQQFYTRDSETLVVVNELVAMHVGSGTSIPDPLIADFISKLRVGTPVEKTVWGLLSLGQIRQLVLHQYFLQSGSGMCHVGRLRSVSEESDVSSPNITEPMPWWGNSFRFKISNDELWLSICIEDEEIFLKKLVSEAKSTILKFVNRLESMFPKKQFWDQRKVLDTEMEIFFFDFDGTIFRNFPKNLISTKTVFSLILPPLMLSLPIEYSSVLRDYVFVRRIGSGLNSLKKKSSVPCFKYVLNPGAEGLENLLIQQPRWSGKCGPPTLTDSEFIALLKTADVFLFSGHGGGEKHWSGASVQRLAASGSAPLITLLMGCSSAKPYGDHLAPFCTPFHYLIGGSALVVGTLWDVLGREMDRMSEYVLERIDKTTDEDLVNHFPKIVASSRSACKLKNISGASLIMYGV